MARTNYNCFFFLFVFFCVVKYRIVRKLALSCLLISVQISYGLKPFFSVTESI